jgi:predicted 3-demethylubiquinone-9 3-methyltransferase (glyoxalase superfamily)
MQKIIPHLWFDKEAKQAAEFYTSLFPDSQITKLAQIKDTPSGDCDILAFELSGYSFMAISAGPFFKINPSISFMLNFDPSRDTDAAGKLDTLWNALSEGGKTLMPLQEYPFSKRYGWVEDKFGVSWQLMLTNPDGEPRPFIMPFLMFTQDTAGNAEEAVKLYTSVFKDAKQGMIARYPAGMEPEKEGTVMFADFMLAGQWFCAMDSAGPHAFSFNEAVSLLVNCETQEEIDFFWEKLSAVPEAEQCGWLKDQFGVSWQITPPMLDDMLSGGNDAQKAAVTQAFMKMKKINIAGLEEAFANAA